MDNWHVRLNFNLSKEKGIKHHSYKEHHKISKISKLGCKILQRCKICMFVFRAEIVTIFGSKMVTISARNTNIYKICKPRKAIFSVFYNIS
jgi:L-cysteine desulfidase